MRLSNMLLLQKAEAARPEITNPLTFAPAEWECGVYLTKTGNVDDSGIQYRIGREGGWTPYVMNETIYLEEGQVVQFQNTNDTFSTSSSDYFQFHFEGLVYAEGNIMSMLNGRPDVPAYAFYKLFENAGMYEPPELPATVIGPHCYEFMFADTDVESVPDLPAPKIKEYSYCGMFYGCGMLNDIGNLNFEDKEVSEAGCSGMFKWTAVNSVPNLKFDYIGERALAYMFQECDNIMEVGDVLPRFVGLNDGSLEGMFKQCLSLGDASNLSIPVSRGERCCYRMFNNCYSLTSPPLLPNTGFGDYCYEEMFANCESLENPPDIWDSNFGNSRGIGCFYGMFSGCTGLMNMPEFSATKLSEKCYAGMFKYCTNLWTARALPATTLAKECYAGMFEGCTNLHGQVELHATTLATDCYKNMFKDCEHFDTVKVHFTNWNSGQHTANWLDNTKETGKFICPNGLSETRGSWGIPEGWTIERF